MNVGRTVFAQLMDFLPLREFRACVARYDGSYKVRGFSCLDQFRVLAFAQLTFRESLRDLVACLTALEPKLYHMGVRGRVRRSTLADANETRDWRIYADFAHTLIARARALYADEPLELELEQTVYAFDATLIELCLSLFPWAAYRQTVAGIKLHTLLDLRGPIPTVLHLTEGKASEMPILDRLVPEAGAIYLLDRGYVDFRRLYRFHQAGAFFVVRARDKLCAARVRSRAVDRTTGLRSDQTVRLTVPASRAGYPEHLRRVRYYDVSGQRPFTFLTNAFTLPALTIAQLYKLRWQVELFFRWIKQHLRITAFYGTSPNAVHTQVWTAITVYVLVAIVKKQLGLALPLYTILQILSVSLFEKVELRQLLSDVPHQLLDSDVANQLSFFN